MGDTIIGVQFGIANPEDILSRSVVEVITDKTYQAQLPVPGGVFDSRFGVIENGKICHTCKQTNLLCPGHFGHITLARPVYLYQFLDTVQKILQNVCLNCSNLYVPDEELEKIEKKYTGMDRFNAVRERTASYKIKELKATSSCPHCESPVIKKIEKVENTVATLEAVTYDEEADKIPLQPELVLRCFQRMSNRHITLLGFNPNFSRPDWMICTVLAVPPLTVRPSVVMYDNQRMEDDLTHKLIDIVRNNQRLRDKIDKGDSADVIDKYTDIVQFDVATYVDNDIKGLPPAAQRSGRPLKTLKSRLGAKTGRVRGNLMGKRVDFSARSVITPDANIDVDELGVPEEIAMNLTFPEVVTVYNRDRLMSYIRNGPAKYPGAKSVFLKDDQRPISLKYVNPDMIDLKEGDIVHRHLVDGDVVLFNRQPSLHKGSMECHRVRVLPYSTFRLNVSATKPYNADFDGDEMNMHVPQSISAASEIKYLASVLRQIVSPRTNAAIISVFQDTQTGIYRLSQPEVLIPEHIAMNILSRMKKPLSTYIRQNKNLSGQDVISSALPAIDFAGKVSVKNGKLVKGILNKGAFASTTEGLVHMIYSDFGPDRAGQFINDIQNIVTKYNLFTGFSVGPSDLATNKETDDVIKRTLADGRQKVSDILSDVHAGKFLNGSGRPDGEELENQILNALKTVASTIGDESMKSLPKTNRMVQMVDSGAKGSALNITQMLGLLAQQQVAGKRIQYTLQDRTLPHFTKFDDGMESRGFVENSFISGLRPAEFFFHAMGGREGLIDTAVKTSDSGYIQRRLVKTMEDLHVTYDGTVRNVNGSIFQHQYGGDGIDSVYTENQTIELAVMSMEQLYKEFGASKDDFASVVNGDIGESPPDLVEELLKDRDSLVKNVFRFKKGSSVMAPVPLKRLCEKFNNPYATKTNLTPDYVVAELKKFCEQQWLSHNKLFHILLRYYLAPKKSIIKMRLSRDMFDELLTEIRYRYIKSRVHPGEMVGTLAAQSIGEPTTQLTLNTFHSAGTAKANATAGVPRIVELLGASHNPKNPGNIVYLDPSISGSQVAAISKMKDIQKTTLRDITKSVRIYHDPNPLSSNSAVQEDREILKTYEKFSVTQGNTCLSPWIMRLELDTMEMAARQIIDMTIIQTKIENNKVLRVFSCVHTDTNSPDKMVLRIVFGSDIVKNVLSLRFIEDKLLDTVLRGVEGIGRVFVREINDELIYDDKVGGYTPQKQYVLDAEGTNLLDLATVPNVDPLRNWSNDIHEILDVFGIEAVRISLYEEFSEVFKSGGETVNYHHMITLVDTMTYLGRIMEANRFGMNKGENGVLAKSSFEETSKILFNAALSADFDNMKGVSANIMFGQKPPCGTGFVDILVDESKLPDGTEEDLSVFEADLAAANARVDSEDRKDAEQGGVRMEDITMDW
jgi:DNA-directed RNA polymerase II subunit RPB1